MATSQMHNLTTLIKRLEAATSRLEDMAAATIEAPKLNGAAPTPAPTGALPPVPVSARAPEPPKPLPEVLPESVEEFDTFLTGPLKKFVNLSDELGGPVAEQASTLFRAFTAQRKFILITTKAKKPPKDKDGNLQIDPALLKPLQESISSISHITDTAGRGSPFYNQLMTVSDSIMVLAWPTIEPKPYKHIESTLESAQFWGNKILKEYKEKDPKQVEWVRAYYGVFKQLAEYVKNTFPQGLPWNPKGVSTEDAIRSVEGAQPSAARPHPQASTGGPPPPPPPPGPPPPPLKFDNAPAPTPAKDAGGLDAVFSELNKGEAVTKGLRKVNPEQMTHKNPSLRAGATVPQRSDSQSSVSSISRGKSPAPSKKPKPEGMRTKKPPVKKLEGNKWIIENYDNEQQPIEIEASISHSVLISRCSKTTIIIKGKANAISIDNSPRLSLVIDSLVSSVDVIKSTNFALQVLGTLPTILMDSVDGAQIYLSKESLSTEVFHSKTSGINLNIIVGEETPYNEGDYKEFPLPEQLKTTIAKDGKILTEIVEHAG